VELRPDHAAFLTTTTIGGVTVQMGIGEVARRAGLRASAIRYYESLGVLPATPRVNGRRRYGPEVLERLAMVRFARYVGFSLTQIRHLLDGSGNRPPPTRWRAMASRKLGELDAAVAQARAIRALLAKSLAHRCPKLVERGEALLTAWGSPRETPGVGH
jgi:MerR family transcriptional regulator, redox-sensitive transcriptional activator SoxR